MHVKYFMQMHTGDFTSQQLYINPEAEKGIQSRHN
jgi:hypothetical protein